MRKNFVRGLLALFAAVGAFVVLSLTTAKPRLTAVMQVTRPVAAGQPVTTQDFGTVWIKDPVPPEMIPAPYPVQGEFAQQNLSPGQTLTLSDLGRTFGGVPPGDVKVLVPVTAGESALAQPGQRVDVLGVAKISQGQTTTTTVIPLAIHVPVLGVFTQSGGTVVTTGSNPAAPGLVALAVTPLQAQALIPYLTQSSDYWLVLDPQGAYSAVS